MFDLPKLIAFLLGRKDNRTIEKLSSQYPVLTKFLAQFHPETLESFVSTGTMGKLDYFLKMNTEELLLAKEKLTLLNGRGMDELGEMIKMHGNRSSRVDDHILFNAYAKLNSFYAKKVDGDGLKRILEHSLAKINKSSLLQGEYKKAVLESIRAYKTSLKRLEAGKHKDLIIEYIEYNLSELECELIINDAEKE
ncbi:MAG TPA: hypothetical protein EYG78_07165 [Sulfurovum sp.]|nr:hypothetical protein [Sulfurovum sp.]